MDHIQSYFFFHNEPNAVCFYAGLAICAVCAAGALTGSFKIHVESIKTSSKVLATNNSKKIKFKS